MGSSVTTKAMTCRPAPPDRTHFAARFGDPTSRAPHQNHDPSSGKPPLRQSSRFFGAAVALAAVVAASEPRADELSPDHAAIYTLQDENASISSSKPTDRYYVNGLRGSYTSGEGDLPAFVQAIGHTLWGDGSQRISFEIGQLIFTPLNTRVPNPVGDEP